jgi:Asp-tRNA(Asn)/Glu-tRNA(Gln) amidotransferase A subunit family amidase
MTRSVEDTLLVLAEITGPDARDVASVPSQLDFDAGVSVKGLKVGYIDSWMKESPATDVDLASLDEFRKLGMVPTEVSLPDWPYDSLNLVLFAEAAAAFEELTLSGQADQLKVQVPDAWPICSARPASSRPSTSCKPTGCGARWRWRWRG